MKKKNHDLEVSKIKIKVEKEFIRANYSFLGKRRYTHGSSMLESMLLAFKEKYSEKHITILEFKIIKEFKTNSKIYKVKLNNYKLRKIFESKKPNAWLILKHLNAKYILYIFENKSKIKKTDKNYNSELFVKKIYKINKDFGVQIIDDLNLINFIRACIESILQITRKNILKKINKKIRIRWVKLNDLKIKSFNVSSIKLIKVKIDNHIKGNKLELIKFAVIPNSEENLNIFYITFAIKYD